MTALLVKRTKGGNCFYAVGQKAVYWSIITAANF